jgi:uncharacterized Zn finger protein
MKKTANCDNCSPQSIFDASYVNEKPVWICRCCGKTTNRRVLNTNKKQERKTAKVGFDSLINSLMED